MGESVALTTCQSGEPDGVSLRTLPLGDGVRGLTLPGTLAFLISPRPDHIRPVS